MFNQIRRFSIGIVLLIVPLALPLSVVAKPLDGLQSIKLLTPQVGWTADADNLYWTTDAGLHWERRTPRTTAKASIADVFFLHASIGWVLLVRGDETGEVQFDTASTEDSGNTWLISRVEIPRRIAGEFSGGGSTYFLDRFHGWMNLGINSSSAFRPGTMLSTEDGGATWRYTPGDPAVAGSFCFFSARDGILSGGPENTELYVTHDGSTSWQQISLKASLDLLADYPTYSTPTCDANHGFLPVTFSGREGTKSALVLFTTNDAGHVFRPDRVLPNLDGTSPGQEVTTALTDSHLIVLGVSNQTGLLLTALPRGGTQMNAMFHVGGTPFAVLKASFADPSKGWALTSIGLLSTSNGGVTWTDITPTGEGAAVDPEPSALGTTSLRPGGARLPDQPNAATGTSANTRLGFDKSLVPLTTQMSTWWKFSPYFESGLYIPGAVNKKKDPNLNSTWVSTVEGYGWGLIPIWVGPQAPCVLQTGLTVISATKPYSQGHAEGVKAIAAAKTLSSSLGPIIYYNMENYNTSDSACRVIVKGFLNGWVNALQTNGYKAGIYGNIAPAVLDFSKLSPLPDDAWISWTPVPSNPPDVSVWGLASKNAALCDPFAKSACTLWSTSQRIHQYLIGQAETWGGIKFVVDKNVVDAAVAVSSIGGKPYAFDYTSIDYPSAKLTNALGINNAGDIVGYYYFLSSAKHGFSYSKGAYTSVEYPGAAQTEAWGINDAGQIVGFYIDSHSNFFGFLYSNGQYTSISLGSNTFTLALGINDDQQMAGYYQDSNGYHGFLKNMNSGVITTIDDGAGGTTLVRGLDGNADVVGLIQGGNSFLYNPISSAFVSLSLTVDGVNDSLQMVGGNILYDYPTNTQTSLQYPGSLSTGAFGINDYSEIVGNWSDSNSVQHGFLATPKQ